MLQTLKLGGGKITMTLTFDQRSSSMSESNICAEGDSQISHSQERNVPLHKWRGRKVENSTTHLPPAKLLTVDTY